MRTFSRCHYTNRPTYVCIGTSFIIFCSKFIQKMSGELILKSEGNRLWKNRGTTIFKTAQFLPDFSTFKNFLRSAFASRIDGGFLLIPDLHFQKFCFAHLFLYNIKMVRFLSIPDLDFQKLSALGFASRIVSFIESRPCDFYRFFCIAFIQNAFYRLHFQKSRLVKTAR
jgi:hypothetical protein